MTTTKSRPKSTTAAGDGGNKAMSGGDIVGAGNVDKIRDILFGSQMREYERKFQRMEERIGKEISSLREESSKRIDSLESYVNKELEALGDRLKGEQSQRTEAVEELTAEIAKAAKLLEPKVQRVDLPRRTLKDEAELAAWLKEAEERIRGLEGVLGTEQTRVEPLAVNSELERYIASNEQLHQEAEPDDEPGADETVAPAAEDEGDDNDDEEWGAPANDAGDGAVNDIEYAGGLRDNLREIKGIGPAIEKTLNELGIFRYAQVAQMTRYDIERIANRLKGFQSRIEREDWIGQARELAEARLEAANEDDRSVDGQAS